jgi:elongation factor G
MTSLDSRTHPRLIEIAIEPKSRAGCEKLNAALATLATDHSGLGVSTDLESGQVILSGMSEQHLDGAISRLKHTYGADINIGARQVAYRETITHAAAVDYTHKKHAGPKSEFAKVRIGVRPTPRGTPFAFQNSASKTAVPDEYISGIERGLM